MDRRSATRRLRGRGCAGKLGLRVHFPCDHRGLIGLVYQIVMLVVTRYGEALKYRFISEIAEVKELPDAPSSETGWMAMANRVARREKPVVKPFDFSPSVSHWSLDRSNSPSCSTN